MSVDGSNGVGSRSGGSITGGRSSGDIGYVVMVVLAVVG